MKKYFILLCFFPLPFLASSQPYYPFPTDSAQWSVRHTTNSPFYQDSHQYKMKGDTVLDGIIYHKIYYSLDLSYSSTNENLHCFLREDTTKKVFVKYPVGSGLDTTEFMLYDFNLAVGDTVTIKLVYYTTDSIFKLVVTNIDSNLFLTGYRKYFGLVGANANWIWSDACDNVISWAEGIGCNYGLLYNEFPQNSCFNGFVHDLVCFWDHGVYVFGGTFCDYVTGLQEVNQNDYSLSVYPNPVTDISVIDLKGENFERIEIYNILGEQVAKYSVGNVPKIALSKKDYDSGIYIYKLFSKDEKYLISKFIVH